MTDMVDDEDDDLAEILNRVTSGPNIIRWSRRACSALYVALMWTLVLCALLVSSRSTFAQDTACVSQIAVSLYDLTAETSAIVLLNPDTGEVTPFVTDYDVSQGLSWSPDNAYLAWTGRRQIFIASLDETVVIGGLGDHAERPRWSPDSTHLAYVDDGGVHVVTTDGQPVYDFEGTDAYRQSVAWLTPDAFFVYARSNSTSNQFVLRLSDGAQFEPYEYSLGGFGINDLSVSPNGTDLVVYGADRDGNPSMAIYDDSAQSPEAEGISTTILAPSEVYFNPALWSPDGEAVAYLLNEAYSDLMIYTDGQPINLTEAYSDSLETAPSALLGWSPDGERVLFGVSGMSEGFDSAMSLYTVGLDGSAPILLADGLTTVENALFTGSAAWSGCMDE